MEIYISVPHVEGTFLLGVLEYMSVSVGGLYHVSLTYVAISSLQTFKLLLSLSG